MHFEVSGVKASTGEQTTVFIDQPTPDAAIEEGVRRGLLDIQLTPIPEVHEVALVNSPHELPFVTEAVVPPSDRPVDMMPLAAMGKRKGKGKVTALIGILAVLLFVGVVTILIVNWRKASHCSADKSTVASSKAEEQEQPRLPDQGWRIGRQGSANGPLVDNSQAEGPLVNEVRVAREAAAKGDWSSAIQHGKRALQIAPDDTEMATLVRLAQVNQLLEQSRKHCDAQDWDRALELANEAKALDASNADIADLMRDISWRRGCEMAKAARQEGRLDDALDLAEQAIKVKPEDPKGRELRDSVEALIRSAPLYYGRRFEPIRWLPFPNSSNTSQLLLNENGNVLAANCGYIAFWDPRTGQLLPATNKMPRHNPNSPLKIKCGQIVGIDANGIVAAIMEHQHGVQNNKNWDFSIVRVLKLPDGEPLASFYADAAALSADGKYLVCLRPLEAGTRSEQPGPLVMYSLSVGKDPTEVWRSSPKRFRGGITFAPDGKTLAYFSGANGQQIIELLDASTGNSLRHLQGIEGGITNVRFSRDSKQVIVRSSKRDLIDSEVILETFSLDSGHKLTSIRGESATWATTTDNVVGAHRNGNAVNIVRLKDGLKLGTISFQNSVNVHSWKFTDDGRNAIALLSTGEVVVLGVRGATTLMQPKERIAPIRPGDLASVVCPASDTSQFRHGTRAVVFYDGDKVVDLRVHGEQTQARFTRSVGIIHAGVRLFGNPGAEVYPIADGEVVDIWKHAKVGDADSGYSVILQHDTPGASGPVYSLYHLLRGPPVVKLNEKVVAGKTLLGVLPHFNNRKVALSIEVRRFKNRHWHRWGGQLCAVESPADIANFDAKEFADNWLDPLKFVADLNPGAVMGNPSTALPGRRSAEDGLAGDIPPIGAANPSAIVALKDRQAREVANATKEHQDRVTASAQRHAAERQMLMNRQAKEFLDLQGQQSNSPTVGVNTPLGRVVIGNDRKKYERDQEHLRTRHAQEKQALTDKHINEDGELAATLKAELTNMAMRHQREMSALMAQ